MIETEFQWITDIPIYFELEPCTIYYFEPTLMGNELSEFIQRVNISKIRKNNIYQWLSGCNRGIKYFVTDNSLGLAGWCNTTSYGEARAVLYPSHYNFVNGRTL